LAGLRQDSVSYIFAGEQELDLGLAGIGPVFAFCETAMKCTFIDFSIEARWIRTLGPPRGKLPCETCLLIEEVRFAPDSPLEGAVSSELVSV